MLNSNTNTKREGHREHEQRNRGGGGRERVRGREKETERERERFFNSCKPFLLCSGQTTDWERKKEGVHTFNNRTGKERRGTGIAWHFVSNAIQNWEQDKYTETGTEGRMVKRRKTLPAK